MDPGGNVAVSGGLPASDSLAEGALSAGVCGLDDLFPAPGKEESDVGLEWLSVFLEDSFSGHGISIPLPNTDLRPPESLQPPCEQPNEPSDSPQKAYESPEDAASGRRRGTKRKRTRTISTLLGGCRSHRHMQSHLVNITPSDPPLLPQPHWLADSELIAPKKAEEEADEETPCEKEEEEEEEEEEKEAKEEMGGGGGGGPKRCSHCLSQHTPQWRAGPQGPKTLCNACGVRYKSGRLFPEYRPAKSPTFVEYKHSNSHKTVMKMRMMANVM